MKVSAWENALIFRKIGYNVDERNQNMGVYA
jgi:hypothetical protein